MEEKGWGRSSSWRGSVLLIFALFIHVFSSKWPVLLTRLAPGPGQTEVSWQVDRLAAPLPWVCLRGHVPGCFPGKAVSLSPFAGRRGASHSLASILCFVNAFIFPLPLAAWFGLYAASPGWNTTQNSLTLWQLPYKQTPKATDFWRPGSFQRKVSSVLTHPCGLIQTSISIQGLFYILCVYQDHWENCFFFFFFLDCRQIENMVLGHVYRS